MKNQIIISLLFLSVGLSQRLSEVIETYENGNVKSITYHKKTRDGIQKVKREGYFEKGQKVHEITYKDGKENGLWTQWYDNGQKWFEGYYNGIIDKRSGGRPQWDGLYISWYENGQKRTEGDFKDGNLISKKEWNEDGSVKEGLDD